MLFDPNRNLFYLQSLRNNLNASLYCDDWWDVTETGHFATIVAYQVIKDTTLK